MKNLKKGIAAALILALLFSCFSCGRKTKRLEKEVRASAEAFAEATSYGDAEALYSMSRKGSGFQQWILSTEKLMDIPEDYFILDLFKPNVTAYKIQKISVNGLKAEVRIEFTHSDRAALIRDGMGAFESLLPYYMLEEETALEESIKNSKEKSMTTVLNCKFCKVGRTWQIEEAPENYEVVLFSNCIQGISEYREKNSGDLAEKYKKWIDGE